MNNNRKEAVNYVDEMISLLNQILEDQAQTSSTNPNQPTNPDGNSDQNQSQNHTPDISSEYEYLSNIQSYS